MTLEKRSNHLRLLLFSTYLLDISTRHFYNFHNYSAGTIPQGVFCEQSSQNPRESLREIMQSMISVHSEACYCEGTVKVLRSYQFSLFSQYCCPDHFTQSTQNMTIHNFHKSIYHSA